MLSKLYPLILISLMTGGYYASSKAGGLRRDLIEAKKGKSADDLSRNQFVPVDSHVHTEHELVNDDDEEQVGEHEDSSSVQVQMHPQPISLSTAGKNHRVGFQIPDDDPLTPQVDESNPNSSQQSGKTDSTVLVSSSSGNTNSSRKTPKIQVNLTNSHIHSPNVNLIKGTGSSNSSYIGGSTNNNHSSSNKRNGGIFKTGRNGTTVPTYEFLVEQSSTAPGGLKTKLLGKLPEDEIGTLELDEELNMGERDRFICPSEVT